MFFMRFIGADCDKICVENPVGFMSRAYQKPTQYIEPYYFCDSLESEEYVTKKTGLWLKNLTPLKRTNSFPEPEFQMYYSQYSHSFKRKVWTKTVAGSKARSKTFIGIAKAMAEQWG